MSATAPKVAREVAEQDFERMCTAYRVDLDLSDLDEDERKEFQALRAKIVRHMMRGLIVVGADGNPTYTAPDGTRGYTFHPPTAATLMATEGVVGKNVTATALALADMTHADKSDFARMPLRDFHQISTLVTLFLPDR